METKYSRNILYTKDINVGVFNDQVVLDSTVNEVLVSFMDIVAERGYRYVCMDNQGDGVVIMSNVITELSKQDSELVVNRIPSGSYVTLTDGTKVVVYQEVI